MTGTLFGSFVLALGIGIAAVALGRGLRLQKRRRRRVHVAVAGCIGALLVLIAGLHQLSCVHLSVTNTKTSTSSNRSSALTASVGIEELLDFRPERSCPDDARAFCERLELPSDTYLRVTSFHVEQGRCGLPLGDTVETTARVELELKWLRPGAYKSAKLETSAVVVADAYGLYGCRTVREPAIEKLAEALSRDIGKEAPKAPPGIVQDVTAVTSGPGRICATLADRSVRCFGAQDHLVTAPEGLKSTEIGVMQSAVCALDERGGLHCSAWEGGNVEPKPAQKICDLRGLRNLTVSGSSKPVVCAVDATERGACADVDPSGSSNCEAIERAFANGRRDVREIVRVDSYTCTLARDGVVSCGAAQLPAEMRRAEHIRVSGSSRLCTLSDRGIVRCAYPCEGSSDGGGRFCGEVMRDEVKLPGITRFATGFRNICGVVPPGRVHCAGDGDLPSDPFPDLADAVDVAVDASLVCALTARRSLLCTYAPAVGRAGALAATGLAVRPSANGMLGVISPQAPEAKEGALRKPFTVPLR